MRTPRAGNKPAKRYTDDFLSDSPPSVTMRPIGIVRSGFRERFAAPRQPHLGRGEAARIELLEGLELERAVQDLDGFSHIWVIYWMHLNRGWNPTVMPPRGPRIRRGLLATRAPHRPNSIGLSAVRLVSVAGRTLHIRGHDMLDGTPVLDIKPYIPESDAIPDAAPGWTRLIPGAGGAKA
ncbi:MAG: tRNA (N6-threonylcarbamoyladenosine(37)-N6)-methyltransferase TrmO [Mariprofundaceae bacterium]